MEVSFSQRCPHVVTNCTTYKFTLEMNILNLMKVSWCYSLTCFDCIIHVKCKVCLPN